MDDHIHAPRFIFGDSGHGLIAPNPVARFSFSPYPPNEKVNHVSIGHFHKMEAMRIAARKVQVGASPDANTMGDSLFVACLCRYLDPAKRHRYPSHFVSHSDDLDTHPCGNHLLRPSVRNPHESKCHRESKGKDKRPIGQRGGHFDNSSNIVRSASQTDPAFRFPEQFRLGHTKREQSEGDLAEVFSPKSLSLIGHGRASSQPPSHFVKCINPESFGWVTKGNCTVNSTGYHLMSISIKPRQRTHSIQDKDSPILQRIDTTAAIQAKAANATTGWLFCPRRSHAMRKKRPKRLLGVGARCPRFLLSRIVGKRRLDGLVERGGRVSDGRIVLRPLALSPHSVLGLVPAPALFRTLFEFPFLALILPTAGQELLKLRWVGNLFIDPLNESSSIVFDPQVLHDQR